METGKLKKCLKGSSSDEGALLKVLMVDSTRSNPTERMLADHIH